MAPGVERPHGGWWVSILGGLGVNALVAFVPAAYAWWAEHVTDVLSQGMVQAVFLAGACAHLAEALYARRVAQAAGLGATASGWFWQTLALGFPSLRLLKRQAAAVTRPA